METGQKHPHQHESCAGHHNHQEHHSTLVKQATNDKKALRRVQKALAINVFFTVIEFVGGLLTGSVSILADAIHDFGDSLSLGLAYFLHARSLHPPSEGFSYGYKRLSLLSAVITGAFVLAGSLFVITEAVPRFWDRHVPEGEGMFYLAVFGILANGLAAFTLSSGKTQNEKVLSWHLMEDVLGWIAVLIGSLLILWQEWYWVDPLLAIAIALFVSYNVIKHLKETVAIFLQAAPADIDIARLQSGLCDIKGVIGIHDLHIWSLDGESHVLSIHVIAKSDSDVFSIKEEVRSYLSSVGHFHSTIEVEMEGEPCLSSCDS